MGFRSTFTTQDYGFTWPEWFVKKWEHCVWFKENKTGTISSKYEGKTYFLFSEICADIQKAIPWGKEFSSAFILVWLHGGGVLRGAK